MIGLYEKNTSYKVCHIVFDPLYVLFNNLSFWKCELGICEFLKTQNSNLNHYISKMKLSVLFASAAFASEIAEDISTYG